MKVYAIAEIMITDPSWVEEYLEMVTPTVESFGGRYLSRTPNIRKIEGDRRKPHIALILEFPDQESATAFYDSDEYRPYRDKRKAGSQSEFLLLDGEDHARPSGSHL